MARPRKINEKSIYIRPALEEVLEKVENYPVTFVGAPAGYGKSVLVSALEKTRKVLRFTVEASNAEGFRDELFGVVGDIETWKSGAASGYICIVVENIHILDDSQILDLIYLI